MELIKYCIRCSNKFEPATHRNKFCNKDYQVQCRVCKSHFAITCKNNKDIRKTCSSACSRKLAVKEVFKACKRCKYFYKGISISMYCGKARKFTCAICQEAYSAKCNKGLPKTCSDFCAKLINSNVNTVRLQELKAVDKWVLSFQANFKRKPDHIDFFEYFNIRPNKNIKDKYFPTKKNTSNLENEVYKFIAQNYPNLEILRRKRPIKTESGRLELDIHIVELKIAFEIQDFLSHSKDSDCEQAKWSNTLKRGPSYHKRKIKLAKEQLEINLYEIWEDEIRDNSYKERITEIIEREFN